ncbi:hypothetical protein JRF84_13840 [Methylobacterium organophilum]|uniref:hypothetical protein n=1 Tax=Methylobacterium organophilum TaxID=410 RepID=UPI0019D0EB12|nr:hypothetical protein [Methylobacterium organophilum]MBN6820660.1 hypothetical protein [Methylobacterium organophilum]
MSNPITTASNPRVGEDVGRELISAAWDLLTACEADMETHDPTDADDEPVGASQSGPTAVQFGHMRRLRKALLAFRDGKLVASAGSGKEETKGADPYLTETTEALVARLEAELGVKGINSVFRRALAIAKEASADAKLPKGLVGVVSGDVIREIDGLTPQQSPSPTTETDPPMSVEEAKPCHWGGGNDIIWCSTCGAEYAYAKGEERPPCPRTLHAAGEIGCLVPDPAPATNRP